MAVGALYAQVLWSTRLRARPNITSLPQSRLLLLLQRAGLCQALGHLGTTVSLGAGPVSFTHVVKSSEPLFSAVVSALLLGRRLPLPVYATLLPVVGGVAYACVKEPAFSWLAFGMAMASNMSFSLRAVWSKLAMTPTTTSFANVVDDSPSHSLTPPNAYALITMASLTFCVPLVILGEGRHLSSSWQGALQQASAGQLIRRLVLSGLYLHLCNEVMFLALGSVHPVTLAVGNTMKRVFVMMASIVVFGNVVTTQAAIGSAVGLAGVLLYSLTKQHYESLASSLAKKEKQG